MQSSETDVFLSKTVKYESVCHWTYLATSTGSAGHSISIGPIHGAFGSKVVQPLPGCSAFTGADQTGCFGGKDKQICSQTLLNAGNEIIDAFAAVGISDP